MDALATAEDDDDDDDEGFISDLEEDVNGGVPTWKIVGGHPATIIAGFETQKPEASTGEPHLDTGNPDGGTGKLVLDPGKSGLGVNVEEAG